MNNVSVLTVAIVLLFGTTIALAAVWYVHPDSIFNCIQDCLDSCATGDTVLVGPGVYYENIIWPNIHGIHLISELGPDATIIDGDSTGRVIGISTGVGPATLISGFAIRNGYLTNANECGAGICCENSSPTITSNVITSNRINGDACGGGIVCLGNSSPIITDNIVSENGGGVHDGISGGGIACADSSAPVISDNTITGNYATVAGGGIYCRNNCTPTITNNFIADNSTGACMCGWIGGGIACGYGSAPVITDNTITGNYANHGGGIGYDNSEPIITGNDITGNTGYCGGGIYCHQSSATISNNIISNDTAVWRGGGIYCYECSPTITGNTVSENVIPLTEIGGGIVCDGSSPIISGCIISSNIGEGVYCQPDFWGFVSNPVICHNDIYDNVGFGVCNVDTTIIVSADSNWWGDATGPYHPTANPGGLGDSVSDYVDFDPWLYWPVGVEEQPIVKPIEQREGLTATILRGPLQLPEGKKCRVFDITGRVVEPRKMAPGVYFVEIDNEIVQKVIKIR
jgi:predicted outer membrane repeat protein